MSEHPSIQPAMSVPRRRRRRWLLWLTLVVVVLVGLPLAAISAWSIRTTGQIDAELARIRAAGEPITAADLEAFYAPPPPERDVTRLWMEATRPLAGKEFVAAAGDLPFVGDRKAMVPAAGQPWSKSDEAERFLATHSNSLRQLHQAAARDGRARYPTRFGDGHAMLLDHLGPLRSGAFLLRLEAAIQTRNGNTGGAIQAIQAIHQLARSLDAEPILVSQFVMYAIDGQAYQQVEAMMHDEFVADADLAIIRAEYSKIRYETGLRRAMIGERAMGIMSIHNPSVLHTVKDPIPRTVQYARSADLALYLECMRHVADASDQTPAVAALEQSRNDLLLEQNTASPIGRYRCFMTVLLTPGIEGLVKGRARATAGILTADAGLAAEQFRRRHGEFPDRIDQLVPEFLPAVPLDPFDGQPLRYLRRDDRCVVYSIGIDQTDDGGQEGDGEKPDISFSVRAR